MYTFDFRRLQASDAEAFREIRLEALRLNPESFGASFREESALPLDAFAARLKNSQVTGAFDAQLRLIGIGALARSKGEKTLHLASIWGVYVRPDNRGFGIARQLIETLLSMASPEIRSFRLSVASENISAIRLYEALGFIRFALDREALKIGERYCDEYLMRLDRVP